MRKKLLIGGIIISIGILYWVFGGIPQIKNYPLKQGPIVAFGDSLVFGYGSTEGNDFVSLLSRKIGEPIINLGVSGDTTEQGLLRINEVLIQKPRITLILLGGNDFLKKIDKAETFKNLRTIITTIQSSGSAVILVGVRGGLFFDSVDDLYADLAHETGSAYVSDILEGLFGDMRYMSDTVHPNDTGYARVALRIYPTLANLLR